MACIAGGIAQAYYGKIPQKIIDSVRQRLPETFVNVVDQFNAAFGISF
jgi:ADP-ribosylglycohydrolase